ncbi:MAG: sugar transferase [Pseudomonadales bacterium]|nr:sugar transferase [Pseudomonadales bacterium]RLT87608.1 MAG: sugar transferase [Ketobacter sp. GenoA1]RLT92937.1 MAG: sugar transferase [Ketobacter sp.]
MNKVYKRILDISVAFVALLLFSPAMLLLSIAIWSSMGRPVLFYQERPGLNSQPFRMMKFKTMRDSIDDDGNQLPDSMRITKLGAFLRSTSLDELPELWNVLKGDMSLVGPRPLLKEYLPLYSQRQLKRHQVRPGITGWAQINGRNSISWKEKFEFDIWYVENQSLWLDLRILILTFIKVVKREGISAEGEASMPKFKGSSNE